MTSRTGAPPSAIGRNGPTAWATQSARCVAQRSGHRADLMLVLVVALAARLTMIFGSPGGLSGLFGYDSGVYYAAGDAFVHGRLPYRDFVLLHPPGIMLVLAPFAELGRVTHDYLGFQVAVLACSLMSSCSAVLITLIGRRLGLSRAGSLAGGLFAAVWFGTLVVDYAPRLECVGTFLFLLGAYFLIRGGRRAALWSGMAIGAAVMVKIWWIMPVVLVLAWLVGTDRRRARPFGLGAALSMAIVGGPFFLAAPSAMWRMVVVSQVIRANDDSISGHLHRINVLSSVLFAFPHLQGRAASVVVAVTVALLIAIFLSAWRCRPARMFVVIALAQLALLVAEPSYLSYYSGYLTGALGLSVAAAVGTAGRRSLSWLARVPGAVALVLAAALAATGLARAGNVTISPFRNAAPGRRIASAQRCVMSDSPMLLIDLDVLSRGLANGCPNWVDVTGVSHILDIAVGHQTLRLRNRHWQRVISDYLLSGNAMITIRALTRLTPLTLGEFARLPVVARPGGFKLREIAHPDEIRAAPGTG